MKRVLLTTFPDAFLHHGGGEREIHLLNDALNNAGVISDIYGPTSLPVSSYDSVIHFSMHGGSEILMNAISGQGRRQILWPNLWFVSEPGLAQLEELSKLLDKFDAVVFKSQAEEEHFSRYLNLKGKDIIRISPLVSSKFFRKDVSAVFRESYGLRKYAIWPGIIEPQKNQMSAVQAFEGLDVTLVISGSIRDQAYAADCVEAAGPNVMFLPPMPFGSELHLSALAHSELFIELPLDFPGTSAVEAAVLGCNMLLTATPWTQELLGNFCTQVDAKDIDAVRLAVRECLAGDESRASTLRDVRQLSTEAILPLLSFLN